MKMAGGRYKSDRFTLSVQIPTGDIMANGLKTGVYFLFYSIPWFCLMEVIISTQAQIFTQLHEAGYSPSPVYNSQKSHEP